MTKEIDYEEYTKCPICNRTGWVDFDAEIEYKNEFCEYLANRILENIHNIPEGTGCFGSSKLNEIVRLGRLGKKHDPS